MFHWVVALSLATQSLIIDNQSSQIPDCLTNYHNLSLSWPLAIFLANLRAFLAEDEEMSTLVKAAAVSVHGRAHEHLLTHSECLLSVFFFIFSQNK